MLAAAKKIAPHRNDNFKPLRMLIMGVPYEAMIFMINVFVHAAEVVGGKPLAQAALPELRQLQPDVLCVTNFLSSGYALGELPDIPVVALGFT